MVKDFSQYPVWRKSNPVSSYGLQRRTDAVHRLLRLVNTTGSFRFVDIGTADGMMIKYLEEKFPTAKFAGVERSKDLCKVAATSGVVVVQGDGRALPFLSGSSDVVLLSATLKHIRQLKVVLNECWRVLAQNGHLMALDPTPYGIRLGLRFGHFDRRYLANIWSLRENATTVTAAGFEVAESFAYMLAPRPSVVAEFAERLLLRLGTTQPFLQQALIARKRQ